MKQGAIFDMDGLLLDTERMYRDSWKQSAQQFGLVHNPDFPRAVCGSNGAHMREIISQYYPQVDAKAFADDCICAWNASLRRTYRKRRVFGRFCSISSSAV